MKPESSLLHPQGPATGFYPEAHQSSPCVHIPLLEDPSTPGPSKWFPSLRSPHQNPLRTPPALISATCPVHLILDLITQLIFGVPHQVVFYNPVTSSLLGPNIFLDNLFSPTLILCSSINVRDQVSHRYKTKGKISSLYINLYIFG